jgi:HSP20 family protein
MRLLTTKSKEGTMIRRLPDVRRGPFLLESNLSRMIDDVFRDFDRVGFDVSPSFGRTDVYEADKQLVFETELPGVKKDEISIKVEDEQLVISGEVKRREEIDRENYFRIGRRYGRFQRCFPLPAGLVEKSEIKAKFEDGILKVTAPLKESIKEKEKPIEVAVE